MDPTNVAFLHTSPRFLDLKMCKSLIFAHVATLLRVLFSLSKGAVIYLPCAEVKVILISAQGTFLKRSD